MLFRALRDFNIPKILSQDMVIFMGLLNDLFPGVDPPRKRDIEFEKVIVKTTEAMGLKAEEDFVLRVVQVGSEEHACRVHVSLEEQVQVSLGIAGWQGGHVLRRARSLL